MNSLAKITDADLARSLTDVLERARVKENFILKRNGVAVAVIEPAVRLEGQKAAKIAPWRPTPAARSSAMTSKHSSHSRAAPDSGMVRLVDASVFIDLERAQ
jgi:hypothetical protein